MGIEEVIIAPRSPWQTSCTFAYRFSWLSNGELEGAQRIHSPKRVSCHPDESRGGSNANRGVGAGCPAESKRAARADRFGPHPQARKVNAPAAGREGGSGRGVGLPVGSRSGHRHDGHMRVAGVLQEPNGEDGSEVSAPRRFVMQLQERSSDRHQQPQKCNGGESVCARSCIHALKMNHFLEYVNIISR
jgi:hypothetical protein